MNQLLRQTRVRRKLRLVSWRLRLHVFRSQRWLSAQIIDDQRGVTVAAVHEKQVKGTSRAERLTAMAVKLVKSAQAAKITAVYFDRGARAYHGALAQFADALRQAGLIF